MPKQKEKMNNQDRKPGKTKLGEEELTTLKDLLVDELKDLYDAEQQLVQALPKVAEAAKNPGLKEAIQNHLEETRTHVQRIEEAFEHLDEEMESKSCKAMKGLLEEGEEKRDEEGEDSVIDAGLIAAAQKVEHYEIAGYGCVVTWANRLGESEVADLLAQTLGEEKQADAKLTEIAEAAVNEEAEAGAEKSE
jgi:ferritin-like metal-binding protein YciE